MILYIVIKFSCVSVIYACFLLMLFSFYLFVLILDLRATSLLSARHYYLLPSNNETVKQKGKSNSFEPDSNQRQKDDFIHPTVLRSTN